MKEIEQSTYLKDLPFLLDLAGINKHLVPMGRTLAYQLASSGEIETVLLGMKRGKRLFLTSSVLEYIQRRMKATRPPHVACK